jgi:hypothetical protein
MKSITELQTDKSAFSIGQAISDGWALITKHLGYYILGGILATLIGMAVGFIPLAGGIANNLILSPCFMASAIYITWRISKGIPWIDFGEIFKGFNFLSPLAISALIQLAAMSVLMILFFFSYIPQIIDLFKLSQGTDAFNNREQIEAMAREFFNAQTIVLFLLLMLALLYISVLWAFKNHFIVIYQMQAWPAMELSRKIASHNLLPLIGLFLLLGIIVIISAIPCGIGLLFSLPLSIGAVYSAFSQITQCDKNEIDNEMFDFITTENK